MRLERVQAEREGRSWGWGGKGEEQEVEGQHQRTARHTDHSKHPRLLLGLRSLLQLPKLLGIRQT